MMSLPNLNTKRLSFKKRNAISARHDFVFRSASIILQCPHRRWCRRVPILKGFVICVSNAHVFIALCLGVENLLPDSSVHLAIKSGEGIASLPAVYAAEHNELVGPWSII